MHTIRTIYLVVIFISTMRHKAQRYNKKINKDLIIKRVQKNGFDLRLLIN